MFYRIDSTKVTLKEYWWGKKDPLNTAFAGMLKLFRVQVPSSVDDPNVESLQPFQVAEESLPQNVRETFAPMMAEMAGLGFQSPVFHALVDGYHLTQIYQATFFSADGTTIGRIHYRIWIKPHPMRTSLFPMFISFFNDKTFLVSTAGKPDMLAPASVQINRIFGAGATTLWHSHQEELARLGKSYYSIATPEALLWGIETYHAEIRDFHLQRGVFKAMSGDEQKQEVSVRETMQTTAAEGLLHAEVLAELKQMEQKPKPTWMRFILILAVSMILFVAAGLKQGAWDYILLLIPILLFHELGHYIAMRTFKYRNLRMFFIPFFGAAVSGRHYNVPGWKKVVVSLMGPVPGIALGTILGLIGMLLHKSLLIKAAIVMLLLNGSNLIPVLPLDGGWVMHAIFFSRHYLLDTSFRLIAALALVVLSAFMKTKSLMYVGIATLVALPISYKVAKVAKDVRAQGISPASEDDQNIPTATAQVIITEVKKAFPKKVTNKVIAQHTLSVFEMLNARPPSWGASLLFLFVHGGSIVIALIFSIVFIVSQSGSFGRLIQNAAFMPRTPYKCGSAKIWRGEQSGTSAHGYNTLTASFKTQAQAEQMFEDLRPQLPTSAAMETFGRTVLLTLPGDDDVARKKWFAQLQSATTNLFVDNTNFSATFSLMCIARTQDEAKAIEQQAQEYFRVARWNIIPPWLAQDNRTKEERERHDLARHTYHRLDELPLAALKDGSEKEFSKKISQARRQGDSAELADLIKEQVRLQHESQQRRIQELVAEGTGKVDVELINLYTNLPTDNFTNALYKELTDKMAARMGRLPVENGQLTPEAAKFAAQWGSVSRNGLILTFDFVNFHRVFDGAPALTDWLCRQGCIDFKYSFYGQPSFPAGDDRDDL